MTSLFNVLALYRSSVGSFVGNCVCLLFMCSSGLSDFSYYQYLMENDFFCNKSVTLQEFDPFQNRGSFPKFPIGFVASSCFCTSLNPNLTNTIFDINI